MAALRRGGELALDRARRVDLELVAFLDVGEVTQHDAALEAGGDFAHVVVEPAQRLDLAVVDDRPVADEAHLRAAGDATLGDVGAGDRADARGLEDLADLDVTERLLELLG